MTGQEVIRVIRNIPIRLDFDSNISEIFTGERQDVRTPKQLKLFTRKWGAIWKIPWTKNWYPDRIESQIISGRYDNKLALRCIQKNSVYGDGCGHIRGDKSCVSAYIMAPYSLMKLHQVSRHFSVSEVVALVQLQRALHKDLREVDPEKIISYGIYLL